MLTCEIHGILWILWLLEQDIYLILFQDQVLISLRLGHWEFWDHWSLSLKLRPWNNCWLHCSVLFHCWRTLLLSWCSSLSFSELLDFSYSQGNWKVDVLTLKQESWLVTMNLMLLCAPQIPIAVGIKIHLVSLMYVRNLWWVPYQIRYNLIHLDGLFWTFTRLYPSKDGQRSWT